MIVSYKKRYSSEGRSNSTTYSPVFGYNYNGQNYVVTSDLSTSFVPKIGQHVKILIDPRNPTKWFQPKNDISTLLFIIVFCVLFMGMGFIVVFSP